MERAATDNAVFDGAAVGAAGSPSATSGRFDILTIGCGRAGAFDIVTAGAETAGDGRRIPGAVAAAAGDGAGRDGAARGAEITVGNGPDELSTVEVVPAFVVAGGFDATVVRAAGGTGAVAAGLLVLVAGDDAGGAVARLAFTFVADVAGEAGGAGTADAFVRDCGGVSGCLVDAEGAVGVG